MQIIILTSCNCGVYQEKDSKPNNTLVLMDHQTVFNSKIKRTLVQNASQTCVSSLEFRQGCWKKNRHIRQQISNKDRETSENHAPKLPKIDGPFQNGPPKMALKQMILAQNRGGLVYGNRVKVIFRMSWINIPPRLPTWRVIPGLDPV